MAYRMIFFDLGGVLVDVNASSSLARLGELKGWTLDETAFHWSFFEPVTSAYDAGNLNTKDYLEQFNDYFKLPLEQAVELFTDIFTLNLDTVRIAERLSSNYLLGIISNTNPLHFYRIMSDFYELHIFQEPVTSYYVKSLKPDRKIFQEACRRFDLSPEECIFIDDRQENIQAAQDIGMHGILFESPMKLMVDLYRADLKF
ncbi:MAG: HAD family phosphatase [candidate division KSB1 bacterium]|nr:HAD family phosphatase [candidate division KSB1 bacterium]MDZ7345382.1 HAD family phosphatase [candidate division KSB1 bacterium]